ncbi:helix-turn-helix domain-containing protein [Amycolatopsis albispora]|uniref:HTH iclR-type domain-containing protein n=1 Tax=Amycolatopsis albispora TaxID=1804986 RepID=A0A344L0L1_9PSEU|nr:hypothetical protein A4R43_02820 [Amycolatopsis albispora]
MPRFPTGESVLARVADLPVATTSRLVAELVAHGLLARDPDGRVPVLRTAARALSRVLGFQSLRMPF